MRKEINLRSDLCVQKECQPRVEKSVAFAVNETRRVLFELINLQVERATQSCPQIVVKCRDRERCVELVETIIDIEGALRAGKDAQAEGVQLHATPLTPSAAENPTSNSVQSFPERTRRKSPQCTRASSRATFNPI